MTMIPCMICSGDGTVEQGRSCSTCNGSGKVEAGFGMTEGHRMAMFNMVVEHGTKWDALEAWCNSVNQKLLYLKNKVDAL